MAAVSLRQPLELGISKKAWSRDQQRISSDLETEAVLIRVARFRQGNSWRFREGA